MFPAEPKGESEVGLSLWVRVKWQQYYGEEYSGRELEGLQIFGEHRGK